MGHRVDELAVGIAGQAVTSLSDGNDTPGERFVEAARQGDRAAFGRLYASGLNDGRGKEEQHTVLAQTRDVHNFHNTDAAD